MNDNNVIPLPTRRNTSWTEVSTRRQCPHKHSLHYIDGWRPPTVARPLATGIYWHEIMQRHYQALRANRKHPDLSGVLDYFTEHGAIDPDHPEHEIGALCLWMYDGYRRQWGNDDEWEFIDIGIEGIEDEFRVPIPDTDITLVGRIDLIIRWRRNHIWVVDHKANKNIPHDKDLDLDDQMPLYAWGLREHYGINVVGSMFNVARTEKLKRAMYLEERFARIPTFRTPHELEVTVREAADTIRSARHPDATRERHTDPQQCKWRCQFVEACIAGRKALHLEESVLKASGFTRPHLAPKGEAR